MAGLGAKKFVDTEVLYAADVNGYLMEQSIMRFATTAARDAAFGGATELTLAEGMTCYIDADNSLYSYDGSAWVKIVSSAQPSGLWKIAEGTLSGSATDFLGCFTSDYDNYRVVIDGQLFGTPGFTVDLCFQFLDGTVPNTGSYYWAFRGIDNSLASYDSGSTGTVGRTGGMATTNAQTRIGVTMDFYGPAKVQPTTMTSTSFNLLTSTYGTRSGGCSLNLATAHTGLRILSAGGQTIAGNVRIYGYRN